MRTGLRPQVVLLLALLLALSFLPLYFAISTYTRTAHDSLVRQQAYDWAHFVNASLDAPEAIGNLSPNLEPWNALLRDRVPAIRLGTDATVLAAVSHTPSLLINAPALDAKTSPATWTAQGIWITLPRADHQYLSVLVRHPASAFKRLDAVLLLYMLLIALALLTGAYYIVTYRIIRPLDAVSRAATRMSSPQRELTLPAPRSREFAELNDSLRSMTQRLLNEEQQLRQKIREVEEATERLKHTQAQLVRSERMASVGQLAAGLAHEIGNPISAIIGLQDLVLEGDLPAEQQIEFLRRMRKESERINRVLRDLLQFARPGPKPRVEQPEYASVSEAIEETLALLRPQPSFRQVRVHNAIASDLPMAQANHEALTQVFLNLLLNAAHACQPSGEIRLFAEVSDGMIEVVVEDTGEGVPEQLRETLFDPFVSGKDAGQGTGLGLSVCRSLVEGFSESSPLSAAAQRGGIQHGSIRLDAEYAEGARFVIRLPLADSTDRG